MRIGITSAQKCHIFVLLFLIPFLLGSAVDLYVPSLPAIKQYFNVSEHSVQLSISAYMLGYALGQLLLGLLSDSLGRKKIMVACGMMFAIVSFASAHATSIQMLIACRFLQGLTISGPAVVCRAIASDCFSGIALAKAMTYSSISWGLGPVIGPFIGGYLQHYFDWQMNFYYFTFYALLTFVYAYITLIETHHQRAPLHPIKMVKSLMQVLCHRSFVMYGAIGSLVYSILVVFNIIGPFLLQSNLHYSSIQYGHFALILGLGYFTGGISNRVLVHHVKPNKIILYALCFAAVISSIMVSLGLLLTLNIGLIILPTFFVFYACGFIFPNIASLSVSLFPGQAGTASAVFGSWIAAGVFLISALSTILKTTTIIPLSLIYAVLSIICLALFLLAEKMSANSRKSGTAHITGVDKV